MYFILHSNLETSFSDTEPENVLWKFPMKLIPSNTVFTLCSCIPKKPYIYAAPPNMYEVAVLKSNIQKAVRRGHVDAAVATAWQLIRQGGQSQTELLRRLPIILLEDTFLHVGVLTRLVWWMMATTRGWYLSEGEYRQLLLDIAWMADPACTPHREVLGSETKDYTLEDFRGDTGRRRDGLLAIWIRSCWGGMHGDMTFLRALVKTWQSREADSPAWSLALQDTTEHLLVLTSLDSLTFSVPIHALPEAVDYHCCSYMLPVIAKYVKEPQHVVMDAIWWHRSALNVRSFFGHRATAPPTPPPFFSRIPFEPFVRKAWTPLERPATQQQSLLQFLIPTVPSLPPQQPLRSSPGFSRV